MTKNARVIEGGVYSCIAYQHMRVRALIKEKGLYLAFLGYWHEVVKKYYAFKARFLYTGKDKTTYSQYGEDLTIDRLLKYKTEGFYVDIGANDPARFNNTKKFYSRGWRGVNVDPNPHCFEASQLARVQDINLNVGVANEKTSLTYYEFEETEVSTFGLERKEKLQFEGFHFKRAFKVSVIPLKDIFAQMQQHIDFISIDTEDKNLEVLESNDWDAYRPSIVCVENDQDHDYSEFFKDKNYKLVATTLVNNFFAVCE